MCLFINFTAFKLLAIICFSKTDSYRETKRSYPINNRIIIVLIFLNINSIILSYCFIFIHCTFHPYNLFLGFCSTITHELYPKINLCDASKVRHLSLLYRLCYFRVFCVLTYLNPQHSFKQIGFK